LANLDRQQFVQLAIDLWKKHLSKKTWRDAQTVFRCFKQETNLDLVELLFQARRTQNTQAIENALNAFYMSLVARGLTPDSAWQYCIVLRGFFKANRLPLPVQMKAKAMSAVPIQTLFPNPPELQ